MKDRGKVVKTNFCTDQTFYYVESETVKPDLFPNIYALPAKSDISPSKQIKYSAITFPARVFLS